MGADDDGGLTRVVRVSCRQVTRPIFCRKRTNPLSSWYEIEGRKRVTGKWNELLHRLIILKMPNPSSDTSSGRTLAHSSLHTISMRSLSLKSKSFLQRRRGRCEQDQSDLGSELRPYSTATIVVANVAIFT
jgi:hypothetical protein